MLVFFGWILYTVYDMIILMLISLLGALYVIVSAVMPLRIRLWQKALIALAVVAVALCFKVMQLVGGGRLFAPDLPGPVVLGYTWLYMTLMGFWLLLIVGDVVSGLLLLVPRLRAAVRRCRKAVQAVLLGAAAALCTVGMHAALRLPEVREVELQLPVREPLRIAVLSDLHADAVIDADYVQAVVERTNALRADVVVIVGDFADGTVEQRGATLRPLHHLDAPLGVYAVPGNHDYYSDYERWQVYLSVLGVCMLNNDHAYLPSCHVVLAGVTDPAAEHFNMERPMVKKALDGAPAGAPVVLLAHQPKVAHEAAECGVALQLSGHTHGGQMPGVAQLCAEANSGWVAGLYRVKDMLLYVSRGTGLWRGSALRLGVPSEITLITLRPE